MEAEHQLRSVQLNGLTLRRGQECGPEVQSQASPLAHWAVSVPSAINTVSSPNPVCAHCLPSASCKYHSEAFPFLLLTLTLEFPPSRTKGVTEGEELNKRGI